MIDFHCHLDLFPNPIEIADRCEVEGIYVLSVTTTPKAWYGTRELERSRIRTALGLHPQIAHKRRSELDVFDKLLPQARYVGEIGLDGSKPFANHWSYQTEVFEHILESCTSVGGRILSIHSRGAAKAVIEQLKSYPQAGIPILHWFSGTLTELEHAIAHECWFSVGPRMVRSEKGRKLIREMPQSRVLTESDGPFVKLPEGPARPWHVSIVVNELSDIWEISTQDTQDILHNNLRELMTFLPS